MKKRVLCLALVLVMALGLMPMAALAADAPQPIPCKYDEVEDFSEGLAAVAIKSGEKNSDGSSTLKWGFIDRTGTEVIPCQYSKAKSFSDGYAAVRRPQGWGIIDAAGTEIIPCQYDDAVPFSDGVGMLRTGGAWVIIDKSGKFLAACGSVDDLDDAGFHEGLIAVAEGTKKNYDTIYKWGFIDKTGRQVISYQYDKVRPFNDNGLAAVAVGTGKNDRHGWPILKWGFIDKTGKEVTPCRYSEVKDFSDGLAAVKLDTGEKDDYDNPIYSWGFVDNTGAEVIPCQYDQVRRGFRNGVAAVESDYGRILIDKAGNKISDDPCPATLGGEFSEGFAVHWIGSFRYGYRDDPRYGYVDEAGNAVTPYCFEDAHPFSEGLAAVKLDGKWGFITADLSDSRNCFYTTAYPSTQTVTLDGKSVELPCYALKDANGNLTNYVGIRDLAFLLQGTKRQCKVGWAEDGSTSIYFGVDYIPNGTELSAPFTGEQFCRRDSIDFDVNYPVRSSFTHTVIDWYPNYHYRLDCIRLTDANGGGYTYCPLRKLGQAMDFTVGWSAEQGVYIETSKPRGN